MKNNITGNNINNSNGTFVVGKNNQISTKDKYQKEDVSIKNTKSFQKVFIVHGHDEEMKTDVATFINQLGLEAIILHERPDLGRTIIEKFEQISDDIDYAIILLSPDDKGFSTKNPDNIGYRTRQNVILELGYFYAKLGREKVCALKYESIEIPSDITGILYKNYIKNDKNWKYEVAREMKEIGFNIDMNEVV